MVSLAVTARCNACDWQPEGDPDRKAAAHTRKTGHATVTEARPVPC